MNLEASFLQQIAPFFAAVRLDQGLLGDKEFPASGDDPVATRLDSC